MSAIMWQRLLVLYLLQLEELSLCRRSEGIEEVFLEQSTAAVSMTALESR